MQSKAADVDSDLAEVPAGRREPMDRIRGLCKKIGSTEVSSTWRCMMGVPNKFFPGA
jgi:hypothetical protein